MVFSNFGGGNFKLDRHTIMIGWATAGTGSSDVSIGCCPGSEIAHLHFVLLVLATRFIDWIPPHS